MSKDAYAVCGLTCPQCGSTRLRVQQTVPGTQGVVRRRICVNGHRFVTEETTCSSEQYNEYLRSLNRHRAPYKRRAREMTPEAQEIRAEAYRRWADV